MWRAMVLLVAGLWTGAAAAQWQLAPQGGWITDRPTARGTAEGGVVVLSLSCRDGAPFLWTLGYPAKPGAERAEAFAVEVDGQVFRPSGPHYPPDGLWTATPDAGLIAALKAGSVARVTPPGQAPQVIRLRGSSQAIDGALSGCGAAPTAQAPGVTGQIVQLAPLVRQACGGDFQLNPAAEMTGDLDGDGRDDIVMDWAGVTCADRSRGRGAGFCGAAMCRIEVVLSVPGAVQQITGAEPRLVRRAFGRMALQTVALRPSCPDGALDCVVNWRFTGEKLEAVR